MRAGWPMRGPRCRWRATLAAAAWLLLAGTRLAAAAGTALQSIEPATIALGNSAQLTITSIGSEMPAITPPMVPGLEFLAVGQTQQIQVINGVTSARTTVIYQVVPQQAGVFSIPSALPGAEPVVLTVTKGNGSGPGAYGTPPPQGAAPGGLPPGASAQGGSGQSSTLPADSMRQGASGAAFVRLRLAKHDLYVGEMVPVDIQVGARDGIVASLNGPPTLNGDAFTLSKLPENPTRTTEVVDGKPFIVFTWHTALVAVKPGDLSLTIDMPLTVRVRLPGHPDSSLFNGTGFEDLFNDPAFQNFFGSSTQRDVTVSSSPETFRVLALPTEGRPADFSGAVGQFTVRTELSQDKAAEGDPITLRMRVSGEGDFERASSSMLHDADGWKTYAPTANFKPQDDIGFRGEKIFEQPLISTQTGKRNVPQVTFSWFDPATKRYEQARTDALPVTITDPAPGSAAANNTSAPAASAASEEGAPAWRPDHPDNGAGRTDTLVPRYFQPAFAVVPPIILMALAIAWLWLRHGEHASAPVRVEPTLPLDSLESALEGYAAAGDVATFFGTARSALGRVLAAKWGVPAAAVTTEEAIARLGTDDEVTRLFMLADEATYSALRMTLPEFRQWISVVMRHVQGASP